MKNNKKDKPVLVIVFTLIRLYQRTLSPDHGIIKYAFLSGACRYHPTCSNYMAQAIRQYGLLGGLVAGARRVLRCHPFAEGGHDPVVAGKAGKSNK